MGVANSDGTGRPPPSVVAFSTGVYSLDALKKAAYKFLDVAVIDIAPSSTEVLCTLAFRRDMSPSEAASVVEAFKIEVLDQDLRESIAAETAPVRNAILALALSKTGLQSE